MRECLPQISVIAQEVRGTELRVIRAHSIWFATVDSEEYSSKTSPSDPSPCRIGCGIGLNCGVESPKLSSRVNATRKGKHRTRQRNKRARERNLAGFITTKGRDMCERSCILLKLHPRRLFKPFGLGLGVQQTQQLSERSLTIWIRVHCPGVAWPKNHWKIPIHMRNMDTVRIRVPVTRDR